MDEDIKELEFLENIRNSHLIVLDNGDTKFIKNNGVIFFYQTRQSCYISSDFAPDLFINGYFTHGELYSLYNRFIKRMFLQHFNMNLGSKIISFISNDELNHRIDHSLLF
jgi:hypothetical protein